MIFKKIKTFFKSIRVGDDMDFELINTISSIPIKKSNGDKLDNILKKLEEIKNILEDKNKTKGE